MAGAVLAAARAADRKLDAGRGAARSSQARAGASLRTSPAIRAMKARRKHDAIRHRHAGRAHPGQPVGLVAAVLQPRHVLKRDDAFGRPAAAPARVPQLFELAAHPQPLHQQQRSAGDQVDVGAGAEQRTGCRHQRQRDDPDQCPALRVGRKGKIDIERDQHAEDERQDEQRIAIARFGIQRKAPWSAPPVPAPPAAPPPSPAGTPAPADCAPA